MLISLLINRFLLTLLHPSFSLSHFPPPPPLPLPQGSSDECGNALQCCGRGAHPCRNQVHSQGGLRFLLRNSLPRICSLGVQGPALSLRRGDERKPDGDRGPPDDRLLPPPLGGRGQSRDLHEGGGGQVLRGHRGPDVRLRQGE